LKIHVPLWISGCCTYHKGINELFTWSHLVMGPDQTFLTQVRLGQPSLVWVWKISPKIPNFAIFSLRVKKNIIGSGQKVHGSKTIRPLIFYWSKVCLGQKVSRSKTGQPLFTAGKSMLGSGQSPSLAPTMWQPELNSEFKTF